MVRKLIMLGQIYWVLLVFGFRLKNFQARKCHYNDFGEINPNLQEVYFETHDVFHY